MGSPASGDVRVETLENGDLKIAVFPFNWDPQRVGTGQTSRYNDQGSKGVSIQLGSPASGDSPVIGQGYTTRSGFPFNWDPQRVGTNMIDLNEDTIICVSIQLGSPASGDLRVRMFRAYQA